MAKRASQFKVAVGLDYTENRDAAPTLSVKGENLRADEIVKLAKRFGVPVEERPELTQALRSMELDETIPEELYEAVAVLLRQLTRRI